MNLNPKDVGYFHKNWLVIPMENSKAENINILKPKETMMFQYTIEHHRKELK